MLKMMKNKIIQKNQKKKRLNQNKKNKKNKKKIMRMK